MPLTRQQLNAFDLDQLEYEYRRRSGYEGAVEFVLASTALIGMLENLERRRIYIDPDAPMHTLYCRPVG